ncbi:MAG: orotate phosphoribosyltransferase [Candidatus Omnitrophica bacterium]|nr:orotate phosphoribosyltransferase [Candidatus Omnitrophota bacterium]
MNESTRLKKAAVMKAELLALLKKDAYFKKEITLSSGKKSNFYIDVRRVSLSSYGLYLLSHCLWDMIKDEDIAAIGGPTLGADPIVGGLCMVAADEQRALGGFLIRKTPKKHGQQQLIEGKELPAGTRVVLLDDVATSGGSFINALAVMKENNIDVVRCLCVVDRQEGACEEIEKAGSSLTALFVKKDFL